MLDPRRRTEPALPTSDERLVAEKILAACMHRDWARSIERYAQYAVCHSCGERLFLSGNFAPELPDSEIYELWLHRLPRSATDEATASAVVQKLQAQGWSVTMIPSGTLHVCVVERSNIRIESSAHELRTAAITQAAARAAAITS